MKLPNQLVQILLIALVILVTLGQLQRMQLTPTLAIYAHEFIVLLIIMYSLFLNPGKFLKYLNSNIYKPLLVFSCWLVVSLMVSLLFIPIQEIGFGILYLGRWWLYVFFLISVGFLTHVSHIKKLYVKLLEWSLIGGLLLGFMQYVLIPDTRFLLDFGWDNHLNRLIGTFFDPGFTGVILVIGFVTFAFAGGWKQTYLPWMFMLGVALTYSRASFVALISGIIILGFLQKQAIKSLLYLGFFVVVIALLPGGEGEGVDLTRTRSISNRVATQVDALDIIGEYPITGVGFNNYRIINNTNTISSSQVPNHSSAPDNSYLFVAATSGIIGLGLFLWMVGTWLATTLHTNPLATVVISVISIHSLFNNTWFYSFVLIYLGLILAGEMKLSSKRDRN